MIGAAPAGTAEHPLDRFLVMFDEYLYFPSIRWDHPWERQQTVISAFAAAHRDRPGFLFPPLGLVAHSPFHRRSWRRVATAVRARLSPPPPAEGDGHGLPPNLKVVVGPFVPGPGAWRRDVTLLLSPAFRRVRRRRRGARRMVLACYANELVASYAMDADFVILDLAERRQANPVLSSRAKALERELARSADVLIADNRATLSDYAAERVGRTPGAYLPQGFTPSGRPSRRGTGDDAPLAYLGNLHHAIDVRWLQRLAAAHPRRKLRLCGEVLHRSAAKILALPNVEYWGRIPHRDIPRFLDGVAWGLIPYKVDAWTAGVFPTKLLEYLDGGVPVLSTDLPEVAQFGELPFVQVVRNPDGALPGASMRGVKAFLTRHTWAARTHAYGELLLEAAR